MLSGLFIAILLYTYHLVVSAALAFIYPSVYLYPSIYHTIKSVLYYPVWSLASRALRITFKVHGTIPPGPCLYISNHISSIDYIVVYLLSRRYKMYNSVQFLTWSRLSYWPTLKAIFRSKFASDSWLIDSIDIPSALQASDSWSFLFSESSNQPMFSPDLNFNIMKLDPRLFIIARQYTPKLKQILNDLKDAQSIASVYDLNISYISRFDISTTRGVLTALSRAPFTCIITIRPLNIHRLDHVNDTDAIRWMQNYMAYKNPTLFPFK
ncbi:hypothetical protein CANCADRAFT_3694 [Tortispora caseinolytica NRRL Y-17796]|uniref:Phospholipid/glycerol acyltransferase domain-containing protein n=1 Tax=Tortispora caseinolytica NRRL Y-17796 TaxID=767744 RepID=A0A1E4TBC3_9ASCO|nr:hypothetical protein CANCADRAFT_3694 [Tortispora caseinolytica NRRL Y-17796]